MTTTWTRDWTRRHAVTADDLLSLSRAVCIRAADMGTEPPEIRVVLTIEQKASIYREIQESEGVATPPLDAVDARWYGLTLV